MKRIFNTNSDNLDLTRSYNPSKAPNDWHLHKPFGLWYSIDNAWAEWSESNMPSKLGKNNFEIKIDESKLYVVKEISDVAKLYADIGVSVIGGSLQVLDWLKLRIDYSGFEIRNLFKLTTNLYSSKTDFSDVMQRMQMKGFDVDSGCIWDLSIVKSVKKI